jgi:hypothetical protein
MFHLCSHEQWFFRVRLAEILASCVKERDESHQALYVVLLWSWPVLPSIFYILQRSLHAVWYSPHSFVLMNDFFRQISVAIESAENSPPSIFEFLFQVIHLWKLLVQCTLWSLFRLTLSFRRSFKLQLASRCTLAPLLLLSLTFCCFLALELDFQLFKKI